MKVCIGGTFEFLHKGHRLLLEKAFEAAGREGLVYIGLSTKKILEKKGKKTVQSFEKRKQKLEEYLEEKNLLNKTRIVPINDKYGLTLKNDFDAIIVSPETKEVAEEINKKRKKNGREKMQIISVPFVLAEDQKPISSRRIRKGEIDKKGKIKK